MKMSKLLALALVLLISVGTLAGSTIAWFTDEVTSYGNKIESGTLKVDLELKDKASGNWASIKDSKAALFNNNLWEPGYTEVKVLKVENEGSLALKWAANIVSASELTKLANVIDIYVAQSNTEIPYPASRALEGYTKVGTVAEFVNGTAQVVGGNLLAKEASYLGFALKMQESADNEYQNLSLTSDGSMVDILIQATQFTSERDSFDDQYDAEATWSEDLWDGNTPTEQPDSINIDKANYTIYIGDAEGLAYLNTLVNDPEFAADNGSKWKYTIELNANIDLRNKEWTPINLQNFVAFEGNGHTIRNLKVSGNNDNAGLFASVGSNDRGYIYVRDLTIDGAVVSGKNKVGAVAGSSPQGVFDNVTVKNATLTGNKYVGGIFGGGNGTVTNCTVMDSSICIPAGGEKEAGGLIGYVSNDGKDSGANKIISGNHVENVTISAPTIAAGLVAQPNSSNEYGWIIEIKDNTLKNVRVMTLDDTANLEVSNNVNNKSQFSNNQAEDSEAIHNAMAIFTARELLALGGKSHEGVISIEADINLEDAAMPTIGAAYGKTLIINGNGHTISNGTTAHTSHNGMKHHGMFYAYTNSTLTINDLNFEGITIDATKDTERNYGAGIVVCFADGGSNVTLNDVDVNNCHIKNNTPDIGDEAGVYVGYQTGTLVMKDCNSTGCSVAGETVEKTGAFIGMVNGTATLTNCTTDLTIGTCNRVAGTLIEN